MKLRKRIRATTRKRISQERDLFTRKKKERERETREGCPPPPCIKTCMHRYQKDG